MTFGSKNFKNQGSISHLLGKNAILHGKMRFMRQKMQKFFAKKLPKNAKNR